MGEAYLNRSLALSCGQSSSSPFPYRSLRDESNETQMATNKITNAIRTVWRSLERRALIVAISASMGMGLAEETVELDAFIVGATRTERAPGTLGVNAEVLMGAEIDRSMYRDIRHSLTDLAGVYAHSDESLGSSAEISIRGNSSTRVLSMVDGVKTNTSIFSGGRFMAGASAFNLDRVEVVRGAQSTLYGSSAIGGAILLETRRGRGESRYRSVAEVGSFNSILGALQGQGEKGELDYSFHVASQESDNERADNEGKMKSYSFRFDYDIGENATLGIASRGEFSDYANPDGDLTPPPSSRAQSDSMAFSAYLETVNGDWTQRATLSLLDEYYRQTGFLYVGDAANYGFDWQNTIDVSESLRLVAGSTLEYQEGNDNSFPERKAENWALFAQTEVAASERVNFVFGARHDDYETAGSKTTWRANGAWMLPSRTKLRGAIGTAFRAPNFFRLYSTSPFALGNPDLKPEESEGWEVGFDQYLGNRDLSYGVTYFRNDIDQLVVWVPTQGWDGSYANRDVAENYGVETYLGGELRKGWRANVAYTWTESHSTNLDVGTISRQTGVPRHQFSLANDFQLDDRWSMGLSAHYVIGRESFGGIDIDNYTLVRARARYRFSDTVTFTGRIENALDEDYTMSYSSFSGRTPARGFAAFGGVEVSF